SSRPRSPPAPRCTAAPESRSLASSLRRRSLGVFRSVLLTEAIDATLRIDELVLAGEERMAVRADFDVERAARRAGLDDVSARAGDAARRVDGVRVRLHSEPVPITAGRPGGKPPRL